MTEVTRRDRSDRADPGMADTVRRSPGNKPNTCAGPGT
jgi:hypothetical protein